MLAMYACFPILDLYLRYTGLVLFSWVNGKGSDLKSAGRTIIII
jgi:hypothetical protein